MISHELARERMREWHRQADAERLARDARTAAASTAATAPADAGDDRSRRRWFGFRRSMRQASPCQPTP
jgi:hypothetical protein